MNEKELFSKRLKEALHKAGYEDRPSVLEREFNLRYLGQSVTFQAVRRWLRGESLPEQDKLQVLARWLDVEPHWLRFGDGVSSTSGATDSKRWPDGVDTETQEVFKVYLELPNRQQRVVKAVIYEFAEEQSKEQKKRTRVPLVIADE